MKYREALTPAEHVTAREGTRRWRRDPVIALVGIALGALVSGFATAWLGG